MPSATTWWWIGIGTGVTALATTGALLIRRARRRDPMGPDLGRPPPPPPVPMPPPGDIATPPPDLRAEICRQWKIGTYRPDWRPELFDVLMDAIDTQIEIQKPGWETEAQRKRQAFRIAKASLREICPDIKRPKNQAAVEELKKKFFWEELWDRIYPAAYNKLHAYQDAGFS